MNEQLLSAEVEPLAKHWQEVATRMHFDASTSEELLGELVDRYSEPHRRYHNLEHIRQVLAALTYYGETVASRDLSILAAFYHDVVYDPRTDGNEAASAELARDRLHQAGVSDEAVHTVSELILSTTHQVRDDMSDDERVFLDCDLLVLGSDEERYRRYAEAIREEYSFVPEEDYRRGRRSLLEEWLRRDRIYQFEAIRKQFEAKARENLERELSSFEV